MKSKRLLPVKYRALMLRTCHSNLTSYEGFQWPKKGFVEAPDWSPEKECGNGLHGLLWGAGDLELLNHTRGGLKWMVCTVDTRTVVDLGGKIKVPHAWVTLVSDDRDTAIAFLAAKAPAGYSIPWAKVTGGDNVTVGLKGTATVGSGGTATAGDGGTATAGYKGTATADDYGTATAGDSGTAIAGYKGTATAGCDGAAVAGKDGTATAGQRGTATAGRRGTAIVGYDGTAITGEDGTAKAGCGGRILINYYKKDDTRIRWCIGYVGENGIKADTPYVCINGKLVEQKKGKDSEK